MTSFLHRRFALAMVLLVLNTSLAYSQELEPRSYANIPVGQTFLVLGYVHSEGGLSPSPSVPVEDAELTIDGIALGMAHTFAIAGSSSKVDAVLSRLCEKGSAILQGEEIEGRRCGYSDPKVRLTWNFIGAPALDLKDFSQWQAGLVVGTSVQLSIPTGDYDKDKLINTGANRWVLRPGIGLSYRAKRWYYDIFTSVYFYQDNDDYFNNARLAQDPLYALQGHLIYSLKKGSWISLNANFFRGGETKKNGVSSDDLQENSRFGVTYSKPISRQHSIKLYANTGVITHIGNDFDTLGLAWQYRF